MDLDFSPTEATAQLSEEDIEEQLLALLRQGVQRRLMADVPIAFSSAAASIRALSTVFGQRTGAGPAQNILSYLWWYIDDRGKELDRHWRAG